MDKYYVYINTNPRNMATVYQSLKEFDNYDEAVNYLVEKYDLDITKHTALYDAAALVLDADGYSEAVVMAVIYQEGNPE